MATKLKYDKYKYRILEILQTNFSADKSKDLKDEIPKALCCSKRTFLNWVYLKQESAATISYEDLYKMAKILNTTVEQLLNFEIKFKIVSPQKSNI